ncbi:hypothetical protein WMF31_07410 [Sorangium sp. So ce1036]|uniref:hypothetical protein n=1 Tax=Sorangium sp. So ce1036 TaxID=3133328 RepID=UPI003F0AE196
MYEVDENDGVVELSDLAQSSVGAPLPVVLANEHQVYVTYIVERQGWDGTAIRSVTPRSEDETIAVVQFVRPSAHFFGPPNDEAFSGHPLASRGLQPYGAFEVTRSSWLRALDRRNRVHPCHSASLYVDLRHFILAFHDSIFECIACGYESRLLRGSVSDVVQAMAAELR